MKVKISTLLALFLLPALAEVVDSRLFIVNIPGFPLSLGRLFFVISGIILVLKDRPRILKNKLFIGILLIIMGQVLASVLSDSEDAVVKSFAYLLLFIGAFGNVYLWDKKWGVRILDGFFIILFSYWSIKSLGQTFIGGNISYTGLLNEREAINHHVPGLLVSVSAAYLAARFFYSDNGLKLGGYFVFFISLLTCLLVESRSNFLISLAILSFMVFRVELKRIKRILIAVPILLLILFSLIIVIHSNETLEKRFTLSDIGYQERSTGMRISYFQQGLQDFVSKPFGKGILETSVEYKGRNYMIHNQYLTFLVGGGLLTLIGLFFFFYGAIILVIKGSNKQITRESYESRFNFGLVATCATFFITLMTIEMSGLLLFFMISFLLYSEQKVFESDIEPEY